MSNCTAVDRLSPVETVMSKEMPDIKSLADSTSQSEKTGPNLLDEPMEMDTWRFYVNPYVHSCTCTDIRGS